MPLPAQFLAEPLPTEPLVLAADWLAEARRLRQQPNPDAMVVATIDAEGLPSARVVLCKDIVTEPGYLTFFSNYDSRKGRALAERPRAALVLHWDHLHRQVRIEGQVLRAPAAESDAYFATRPWQRRIGAWASAQSQPVGSRAQLEADVAAVARRFGVPVPGPEDRADDPGVSIPRPPFWGGYHVWAEAVELWVEGESRIHDRARWTRSLTPGSGDGAEAFRPGPWSVTRLQP
ncbi:MAG: pyridoxamine 5'-phosphate oxidase [Steroidobacteraceae bacterium]|nr:pyridoxamine 5'-phosphate oxidase [Nevskiaceae bacterium]MCP5471186.1 pyridoxamine 5'-phosphate oxidase [Nevskiaceae bacterium]